MNLCLNCNKETSFEKYCCRSCSSTFTNKLRAPRTEISKLKTSKSISQSHSIKAPNGPAPRTRVYFCVCSYCAKKFISAHSKKLTCSAQCKDNICSQNGTLKRRVYYKSFTFQSTWEIKIAEYLDANNIVWLQPTKRIKWFDVTLQKSRTYLPDFYLPLYNYYLDVKNPFKQLQDADKLAQLKSVIPLYVGDIPNIINFVVRLARFERACVQLAFSCFEDKRHTDG